MVDQRLCRPDWATDGNFSSSGSAAPIGQRTVISQAAALPPRLGNGR